MPDDTRQLTRDNVYDIAHWCAGDINDDGSITIPRRSGDLTLKPGQWITDTMPGRLGAFTITDTRPE